MNEIDKKIKWLMSKLSSVYCNNCEGIEENCYDCHRKSMGWSIGYLTAKEIVEKLGGNFDE